MLMSGLCFLFLYGFLFDGKNVGVAQLFHQMWTDPAIAYSFVCGFVFYKCFSNLCVFEALKAREKEETSPFLS